MPRVEVRGEQLALATVAREALAEQRAERGVERDLVGDLRLVEQPARGERVLDEHAVAEAVDREDRRAVERGDRGAQQAARGIVDRPTPGAVAGVGRPARARRSSRSRIRSRNSATALSVNVTSRI